MLKDLKRSIRNKYKRREALLYYAIKSYLNHAEERLNESLAGKARDRKRIEKISQKCREMMEELPEPKDYQIDPNIDIEVLLGENNTDEILKAGKEWFESLSAEEVEEIRNFADKNNI